MVCNDELSDVKSTSSAKLGIARTQEGQQHNDSEAIFQVRLSALHFECSLLSSRQDELDVLVFKKFTVEEITHHVAVRSR